MQYFRFSVSVFCFVLLFCLGSQSQTATVEVTLSISVQLIGDRPFFLHPVKQGQTLYSISRAYGISQDLIMSENPELEYGLKFDQLIRIPAFSHVVNSGETAFALSRRFGITLQQLHAFNPDILVEGLKAGQVLYIPGGLPSDERMLSVTSPNPRTEGVGELQITKEHEEPTQPTGEEIAPWYAEKPDTVYDERPSLFDERPEYDVSADSRARPAVRFAPQPCYQARTRDTYHVALLIPFFLEDFANFGWDSLRWLSDERAGLTHKSFSFLPYYHGVLLALDSIRDQGFDIRLHVFDVDQDEQKARKAVSSEGFTGMDLIIGPFYNSTLRYVAGFAMHHDIPVVSPLLAERDQLDGFPNVLKANPSLEVQLDQLARYIGQHHADHRIIFVHNNQPQALNVINGFKKSLNAQLAPAPGEHAVWQDANEPVSPTISSAPDAAAPNFIELIYMREGMSGLLSKLERNNKNIIVTLIGGEAFLSNYLRELNMHIRQFDIEVFGIPDWKDYQSIEIDYLQNLKVHLFTPDFYDYKEPHIRDFVYKYRSEFGTEPNDYALKAVHTAYFFFNALATYGTTFTACMHQVNNMGLQYPFEFIRPMGNWGGWENTHFTLFKYTDYQMLRVYP